MIYIRIRFNNGFSNNINKYVLTQLLVPLKSQIMKFQNNVFFNLFNSFNTLLLF